MVYPVLRVKMYLDIGIDFQKVIWIWIKITEVRIISEKIRFKYNLKYLIFKRRIPQALDFQSKVNLNLGN